MSQNNSAPPANVVRPVISPINNLAVLPRRRFVTAMSQNNSAPPANVVRPVISPINNSNSSTDRQDEPREGGAAAAEGGDGDLRLGEGLPHAPPQPPPPLPSGNDFPSLLTCPILQEPPARPVTFMGHRQSFEHSQLWRYIQSNRTRVKHPTTRERVSRVSAIGRIALVTDRDRTRILQERLALGLGPNEDAPMSRDEYASYLRAMGPNTLAPPPPSESNDETQPNNINIQANNVPMNISANDNFPSRLICPITLNPPANARSFTSNSDQLFEYSALYRMIAIRGTLSAARFVFHPLTRERIRRDRALNCVNVVSPAMTSILCT